MSDQFKAHVNIQPPFNYSIENVSSDLQLDNWSDLNEYIDEDTDKYVLYKFITGKGPEIDENVRLRLLAIFSDVEIRLEINSPFYWIKCFKK